MANTLQKQFWNTFREKYNYKNDIDLLVYDCERWFRLPNQLKDNVKGTEHITVKGKLKIFFKIC